MKKLFFILIMIIMICIGNTHAFENRITDIENHWAKENITRMIINGKLNGYPDNTFRPNDEVTVLEFIKILIDTLDVKLVEEGLAKWPNYYIATVQKYDLDYDYYKKLTRYEMVEIISKMVDLKSETNSKNKFKDVDSKYKANVMKLSKLNVINGYEDGTFRGNNNLTRAEAVTIALRTLEAKQNLMNNKKYEIKSEYTNLNREDAKNSKIDKIRYEIKNDKIYFYDNGRFSDVYDYTINEKYVTNKKIINIIKNIISDDCYVAVYYVPSKYIINQIIIKCGENDDVVNRNLDYFSFTYYEDKLYDLGRITLKDIFSNECYMKVSIKKLWKENYQYENGIYIDERIQNRLNKALKIEFGKDAEEVLLYMNEKYETNLKANEAIAEQKQIGKYLINTYKTDATSLDFYIEKLSS